MNDRDGIGVDEPPATPSDGVLASRQSVSVVVPIYNEAPVLRQLLDRLVAVAHKLEAGYEFSFVFVDDGSADGSFRVIRELADREPRLHVVQLRRHYGQTAALQTGFDRAAGTIVVSMDADLQHFPEDIPRLLDRMNEGYDVVCGWRRQRREGVLRRWPSAAANWLARKATGLRIHDIGTTFRAYRAEILHDVRLLGENHRFVPVFARQAGARIGEVTIENAERPIGKSNYGLSRTFDVLIDIIFMAFYVRYLDRPMRIFGRIGLAVLFAAAIIAVALTVLYVRDGVAVVREHSGWFTLGLVLGLGGLQFLLFGVLSELLVRVYFATRQRSPYPTRRGGTDHA